jgi:hypothetical protein
MKVSASKAIASPTPMFWRGKAAISAPATAGPTKPISCMLPCMTELPACRSSDGTRVGAMDMEAGANTPPTIPKTRLYT